MLYKNSIKDDKRNLGDGQIWFNNQEKKGTSERKDLLSCLVVIPLMPFPCWEMSSSTQCSNCDGFHLVWVLLGVAAIPSPSAASLGLFFAVNDTALTLWKKPHWTKGPWCAGRNSSALFSASVNIFPCVVPCSVVLLGKRQKRIGEKPQGCGFPISKCSCCSGAVTWFVCAGDPAPLRCETQKSAVMMLCRHNFMQR